MKVTWAVANASDPGTAESAWVRADGTVVLAAYRSVSHASNGLEWRYTILTPADGPPASAILQTDLGFCGASFTRGFENRYVIRVAGPTSVGFIAGELEKVSPRLGVHLPLGAHDSFSASALAIEDLTDGFALQRYAWTDGSKLGVLWSPTQDDGLQQNEPISTGDAIFWGADNLDYAKVHVFTPEGGVVDFLSAGHVKDHGFDDLGTDGFDSCGSRRKDVRRTQERPTATSPMT